MGSRGVCRLTVRLCTVIPARPPPCCLPGRLCQVQSSRSPRATVGFASVALAESSCVDWLMRRRPGQVGRIRALSPGKTGSAYRSPCLAFWSKRRERAWHGGRSEDTGRHGDNYHIVRNQLGSCARILSLNTGAGARQTAGAFHFLGLRSLRLGSPLSWDTTHGQGLRAGTGRAHSAGPAGSSGRLLANHLGPAPRPNGPRDASAEPSH